MGTIIPGIIHITKHIAPLERLSPFCFSFDRFFVYFFCFLMNCLATPGRQTIHIQAHELYWSHITKLCNTHQLIKVQPVAWPELFLVQTLPFQSLLECPKHCFSSNIKISLQEVPYFCLQSRG